MEFTLNGWIEMDDDTERDKPEDVYGVQINTMDESDSKEEADKTREEKESVVEEQDPESQDLTQRKESVIEEQELESQDLAQNKAYNPMQEYVQNLGTGSDSEEITQYKDVNSEQNNDISKSDDDGNYAQNDYLVSIVYDYETMSKGDIKKFGLEHASSETESHGSDPDRTHFEMFDGKEYNKAANLKPNRLNTNALQNAYDQNVITEFGDILCNTNEGENSKNPVKAKKKFYCQKCNKSFLLEIIMVQHQANCKKSKQLTKIRQNKNRKTEYRKKKVKVTEKKPQKITRWKTDEKHAVRITRSKEKRRKITQWKTDEKHAVKITRSKEKRRKITRCKTAERFAMVEKLRDVVYYCSVCNKSYSSRRSLKRHQKCHTGDGWSCKFCEKTFPCQSAMKKHLRVHTNDRPFLCETCSSAFTTSSGLNSHKLTHDKSTLYQCAECNKSFSSLHSLKRHQKYHRGEVLLCPICCKQYTCKSELVSHSLVHTNDRPFICEKPGCGKHLKSASSLKLHEKTHIKNQICSCCSVCNKSYLSKGSLKRHQKCHTGDGWSCKFCEKTFPCQSAIEKHLRVHTNDRPFLCETCSSAFTTSSGLNSHKLTHDKSTSYQCGECNKSFSSMHSLKRHQKYHRGEVLLCPICGKQYTCKSELVSHSLVHTNDRPFICEKPGCGKRLKSASSLKLHEKTHVKNQIFSCDVCLKTFAQACSLKRHKRFHTGNVICCKYCENKFTCQSELNKHIVVHTNERNYTCKFCDKKFKLPKSLKEHQATHIAKTPEKTCF